MSKWICRCGKENINNFCAVCGAGKPVQVSGGWNCSCGSQNSSQAAFCKNCGNARPVAPRETRASYAQPVQPPPVAPVGASSQGSSKTTFVLIGVIGLIVALIGCFVYFNTSEPAKVPSDNSKTTQASTDQSSSGQQPAADTSLTELSLGGINIGDNRSKVIQKYGQPFKVSQEGKTQRHYYSVMEVVYRGDRVTALVSNSASVQTKRGFHDGSSVADIRASYGEPDMLTAYEGLDLYEYNRPGPLGPVIIRYAIRQNGGTVDYISIRTASNE